MSLKHKKATRPTPRISNHQNSHKYNNRNMKQEIERERERERERGITRVRVDRAEIQMERELSKFEIQVKREA